MPGRLIVNLGDMAAVKRTLEEDVLNVWVMVLLGDC